MEHGSQEGRQAGWMIDSDNKKLFLERTVLDKADQVKTHAKK